MATQPSVANRDDFFSAKWQLAVVTSLQKAMYERRNVSHRFLCLLGLRRAGVVFGGALRFRVIFRASVLAAGMFS